MHQLFDRKVKKPCQIATSSHLRIMEPLPVPEDWAVVKYTDDGAGEKLESFQEINLIDGIIFIFSIHVQYKSITFI